MKKSKKLMLTVMGLAVFSFSAAKLPLSALAHSLNQVPLQSVRSQAATSGDAHSVHVSTPGDSDSADDWATPGDLATPGNGIFDNGIPLIYDLPEPPVTEEEDSYTFCSYYLYVDDPVLVDLEVGFSENDLDLLSQPVSLYLDGPDGHLDQEFELSVDWDLSEVDFTKAGEYTVTGVPDISGVTLPVDWSTVPPPSFSVRVTTFDCLSFRPEADGDTLTLHYELHGEPFSLPVSDLIMELYESQDNGENWRLITYSRRVQIFDDRLTVSGVTSDSMFQAVDLFLGEEFPYYYPGCSDIVKAESGGSISSIQVIASGGIQGGTEWGDKNWDSEPVMDGPYHFLKYGTGGGWPYMPLELRVPVGETDWLEREYYDSVKIFYGDRPDGFWNDWLRLGPDDENGTPDVEWDWSPADSIDWNQVGDTVIHGTFTDAAIPKISEFLDFEQMPELTLTISVYEPELEFLLDSEEEKLYEDSTVRFLFYDGRYGYPYDEDLLSLEDLSKLTIWCSVDGENTWYDITALPNVSLGSSTLSVSHLNRAWLGDHGYSFQVEQTLLPEYTRFSNATVVSHGMEGISIRPNIGGERGGGKRYAKVPEGLFDIPEADNPPENSGGNGGSGGDVGSGDNGSGSDAGSDSGDNGSGSDAGSDSGDNGSGSDAGSDSGSSNNGEYFDRPDKNNVADIPPFPADMRSESSTENPNPAEDANTAADPPVSDPPAPESPAEETAVHEPETAEEASGQSVQTAQEAVSDLSQTSRHGVLKAVISILSLSCGIGAGIFLIRRR